VVIRAGDRVAGVLARDERLLEVFTAASPHFQRLRDPGLRRVMTRLVTVGQAARIAGVDADALVACLNRALAAGDAETAPPDHLETTTWPMPMTTTAMPAALQNLSPERILDVDVRDDLRAGREPFQRIMTARQALKAGQVLRLRAIFEPVPLYHVLGKLGYGHWTEQFAPDDWRVWFYPGEVVAAEPATQSEPTPTLTAEDHVVVLDVRGLEPPEPMVRTLAALEQLPEGGTLVQINVRVPQFLLPKLDELGYRYEVREQSDELVRLFIRRS
jgi:uncharacterized protein (DUF2249 family)